MTKSRPPPYFANLDHDALMERLIDAMTSLVSMESDFQAARLNLETITDILGDTLNDCSNQKLKAKYLLLTNKGRCPR